MSRFLDRLAFFKRRVGAFSNRRPLGRMAPATLSPVAAWSAIVERPGTRAGGLNKRGLTRARWREIDALFGAGNAVASATELTRGPSWNA